MKLKNKRLLILLIAAALVIAGVGIYFIARPKASSTAAETADGNLLQNGSFTQLDQDGMPEGWYTQAYDATAGTVFETTRDGVYIRSALPNDARFAQHVSVQPNTTYCLSGKVRANTDEGRGANLSVEGLLVYSDSVYQSKDAWQEIALYGRTSDQQESIVVLARLGGYGEECAGEAWFRDLSLTVVTQVPEGAEVVDFFLPQVSYSQHTGSQPAHDVKKNASSLMLLVSAVFICLFMLAKNYFTVPLPCIENKKEYSPLWLAGLLVVAFVVRLIAAIKVPGYNVDIGCFTYWANTMAEHGPLEFYNAVGFCDYPPGYMNILWCIGLIGKLFGGATELMVKMPSVIADVLICLLLYTEGKKRMNQTGALLLSAFWALNPVSIVAGACWGQTDSLMTLFMLFAVFSLMKGQWKFALPAYVIAVLMKPQALMFGPLGVAALILHLKTINNRHNRNVVADLMIGLALSVMAFATLALPFLLRISPTAYLRAKGFEEYEIHTLLQAASDSGSRSVEGYRLYGNGFSNLLNGIKFIFSLYGNTMNSYAGVTINACNIYFLLNLNWADVGTRAGTMAIILVFMVSSLPSVITFFTSLKKPGKRVHYFLSFELVLVTGCLVYLLSVMGILTYELFSTLTILYIVIQCLCLFLFQGEMRRLPVYGAAMMSLLFSCCGMMHERYLLPVIVLLMMGYITTKDKRLLYLMVLTSVASFLNITCVLDRNIRIGGSAGHLNAPAFYLESDLYILEYLSAVLTTVATVFCVYLAVLPQREFALPKPKTQKRFPDALIILMVTCLYAVLAFSNLGATTSPQTAWTANNFKTVLVPVTVEQEITDEDALPTLTEQADETLTAENTGEETAALPETPESEPVSEMTPAVEYVEEVVLEPETILLDLGKDHRFSVQFFSGIHLYFDASFTVESGSSPDFFSDNRTGFAQQGNCFQWQYVSGTNSTPMLGRYVRITANDNKLMLFEILFRDYETGEILPYSILESSNDNPTAANIGDEQNAMVGSVPSWYNSAYFDEIYHARTGYEHLHHLITYETSHPPLGKVLMSWAIAIFGMTPFGWRFAGALAGVLMLPGMYLLGKMFSKNKWGGLVAMLLMTFDLMHFTQTRIATIDSFVVLFIIWAVYFMLYWFRMDYYNTPFWKTLVPLFLSGLFAGFSIASKWTGVYNIVALAIIFFWAFILRFREWLKARKTVLQYQSGMEEYSSLLRSAKKNKKKDNNTPLPQAPQEPVQAMAIHKQGYRLPATIGLCVLFFIVIPLLIYYLSYIPYFAFDGEGVTVEKVIHAAVGDYLETGELDQYDGMLGYHSQEGLGMDHPYYSPWYEWPVVARPMYYYAHSGNTPDSSSTIVLMGNPAVWWIGLLGLLGVIGAAVYRHVRLDIYKSNHPETALARPPLSLPRDPRYGLLIICFLVQYLPWVLVPRGTYIYHYFTALPFVILCTTFCLDKLYERRPVKTMTAALLILHIALTWFIAFFPYASGIFVSQYWLRSMQWFDNWIPFAAW